MKNFIYYLTPLLLIVQSNASCLQPKTIDSVTIDKTIHEEINKHINPFNKEANSCVIYRIYDGDKIINQSKINGDPGLSFTFFDDKNIVVTCLNGIDDGLGFSLLLNKDTSILQFRIVSKPEDTIKGSEILPEKLVRCKSQGIRLIKQPKFERGEIIEGKISLESDEFLEMINNEERTLRCVLEVWFRSEPMPIIEGKYKTLEKKLSRPI